MENCDLIEYGRLIKDGELKMRSHEESRNAKTRYVFLFNRGVIFCKATRVISFFFFLFYLSILNHFHLCTLSEYYKLIYYKLSTNLCDYLTLFLSNAFSQCGHLSPNLTRWWINYWG